MKKKIRTLLHHVGALQGSYPQVLEDPVRQGTDGEAGTIGGEAVRQDDLDALLDRQ